MPAAHHLAQERLKAQFSDIYQIGKSAPNLWALFDVIQVMPAEDVTGRVGVRIPSDR